VFHRNKPHKVLLLELWQFNYPNHSSAEKVENQSLLKSSDELARNQEIHRGKSQGK
jgi:hypothetical protein